MPPVQHHSEAQLLEAARGGDPAAFERLVRPRARQLLAVAAGFAHTPTEADDIYQDAMLAAYRALPQFRGEAKFSTYLHRIVVTTALSNRRRWQRAWAKLAALGEEPEAAERYQRSPDPEGELLREELSDHLQRALGRLSAAERMTLVLCHQQGFKLREAAEIMGSTEGAVKVRLFRARAKMRRQLAGYLGKQ